MPNRILTLAAILTPGGQSENGDLMQDGRNLGVDSPTPYPPIAHGEHYKVVFENEQVRVLHVGYDPHEKGCEHQHVRDRLVVNLSPALRAKYGDVRMIGPETHKEENTTEETVERLAVKIK